MCILLISLGLDYRIRCGILSSLCMAWFPDMYACLGWYDWMYPCHSRLMHLSQMFTIPVLVMVFLPDWLILEGLAKACKDKPVQMVPIGTVGNCSI